MELFTPSPGKEMDVGRCCAEAIPVKIVTTRPYSHVRIRSSLHMTSIPRTEVGDPISTECIVISIKMAVVLHS
jgi:hypothetical protein